VHQRFYCKSRLATEIQGASRQTIFQHGDLVLAQQRRQDDSIDVALLATDQQRSVLQTLKQDDEPQPIAYSPYGHHRAESGLSSLLGFNGERADPITGHYLLGNGYRAFNPVLMRFNSPDSWSPFGRGGLNAYAYCEGEPVSRTDPTGHSLLLTMKTFLGQKIIHGKKGYTQIGFLRESLDFVDKLGTPEGQVKGFLQVNKTPQVYPFQKVPQPSAQSFGVLLPDDLLGNIKTYAQLPGTQVPVKEIIHNQELFHAVPPDLLKELVITRAPVPGPAPRGATISTRTPNGNDPGGPGGPAAAFSSMHSSIRQQPPPPSHNQSQVASAQLGRFSSYRH
jgi:RHS repeat-associated protein